jgi:thiamine monophosphate synthase
MAITAADLANLQAALASGERVVQIRDRRIEYRTVDELQKAIELAKEELAIETATPRVTRAFAYHRSGL